MPMREASDVLEPGYLAPASDDTRLSDGQLDVAAWTTLPGCSGSMVEWWCGYPDPSRFTEAGVSAAIRARVRALEAPVWAGHGIHPCRDTDYGREMRCRSWLGDFDPPGAAADRETRMQRFPDRVGEGQPRHRHAEMTHLAGFLPEPYAQEASPAAR